MFRYCQFAGSGLVSWYSLRPKTPHDMVGETSCSSRRGVDKDGKPCSPEFRQWPRNPLRLYYRILVCKFSFQRLMEITGIQYITCKKPWYEENERNAYRKGVMRQGYVSCYSLSNIYGGLVRHDNSFGRLTLRSISWRKEVPKSTFLLMIRCVS